MWFTPASTASRNTASAPWRSFGGPKTARSGELHRTVSQALHSVAAERERAGFAYVDHAISPVD